MYQNNETVTMLVFQTDPLGVEVFSYVKMEVLTFGLDIYLFILLYLIDAKLESREKSILLYFQ